MAIADEYDDWPSLRMWACLTQPLHNLGKISQFCLTPPRRTLVGHVTTVSVVSALGEPRRADVPRNPHSLRIAVTCWQRSQTWAWHQRNCDLLERGFPPNLNNNKLADCPWRAPGTPTQRSRLLLCRKQQQTRQLPYRGLRHKKILHLNDNNQEIRVPHNTNRAGNFPRMDQPSASESADKTAWLWTELSPLGSSTAPWASSAHIQSGSDVLPQNQPCVRMYPSVLPFGITFIVAIIKKKKKNGRPRPGAH